MPRLFQKSFKRFKLYILDNLMNSHTAESFLCPLYLSSIYQISVAKLRRFSCLIFQVSIILPIIFPKSKYSDSGIFITVCPSILFSKLLSLVISYCVCYCHRYLFIRKAQCIHKKGTVYT